MKCDANMNELRYEAYDDDRYMGASDSLDEVMQYDAAANGCFRVFDTQAGDYASSVIEYITADEFVHECEVVTVNYENVRGRVVGEVVDAADGSDEVLPFSLLQLRGYNHGGKTWVWDSQNDLRDYSNVKISQVIIEDGVCE